MLKLNAKILERLISRFRVFELGDSRVDLTAWLATRFGDNLYGAEAKVCSKISSDLSGYRVAQLGISSAHTLLDGFQHNHKFILASALDEHAGCVCDFSELPLPGNMLDAIVLHHVLDFSPEPHHLLNEAARVVSAGGYIVVVAFNPFSIFGLAKWPAVLVTRSKVWRHNSLRRARLTDWLQLIGFQVVAQQRVRYQRTKNQDNVHFIRRLRRFISRRISSGAFYVVVARKQVTPLNPIRHAVWQPVRIPALKGLKTMGKGDRGDCNNSYDE